jgi:hypothetical protein
MYYQVISQCVQMLKNRNRPVMAALQMGGVSGW